MDRNREARRLTASTNGVSRRPHRTTNHRDSPEDDRPGRSRDRDRVRLSKRRRNDEESSEGSESDDVEEEDDEGTVRMVPPHQAVTNHGHSHVSKEFRPVQRWKPADQVIGVSVPRKARSASTKRSHENWISAAGTMPEQNHRQSSPSTAPLSPSSSNVSARKKMKPNGGSTRKPPRSSSNATSSNPEELEMEIAEVLFGLMTQKEADSATKSDFNRPNNESKSRVSSPIPNSASSAPQNSCSSTVPFTAIAPKRKKPRHVPEDLSSFGAKGSLILSPRVKSEIDQLPKIESLFPYSEKRPINGPGNGNMPSLKLDLAGSKTPAKELPKVVESPVKDMLAVKPEESCGDVAMTTVKSTSSDMDTQREEKFEIDLMAPASLEKETDIGLAAEPIVSEAAEDSMAAHDKDDKASENSRDEMLVKEPELKKAKSVHESVGTEMETKIKERNVNLQLDLETADRDGVNNAENLSGNDKSHPRVEKQQQPQSEVAKDEQTHMEKTAQSNSLPLPMSLAPWPGGLPPIGYMAPLQGVVSMDGSQVPPTPVQPMFSQPRPKRCATHSYIARSIYHLQQLMKMNPFWPATAAGPASLFGAKPGNLNVVPAAANSVQDKGQPATLADAQRKQQQVSLQQAFPPGAPSNMMPGPAFIFPFKQQQAATAAAAASVQSGSAKSSKAAPNSTPVTAATSASANGSAAAAPTPSSLSFNYPNMPSNETQYLAILQNNAYPFPIPASNYRGGPHPQAIPFFNGSFYTSQMIPQQQIQPGQLNASISNGSSSSQKHIFQSQQQRPQQGAGNLDALPAPKTRNIESEKGNEDRPSTADSRSTRDPMNVYGQNFSMPTHQQNFSLVSSTQALVGTSNGNSTQSENKKQQVSQQQSSKSGRLESLPQAYAMSFDLSVAHNHAVFQNQAAAVAQATQQRKNGEPSNITEEKKGLAPKALATSGQSIAFSRPDLTDPSVSSPLAGTNVVDSSARNQNLSSSANKQLGQFQHAQMQQQLVQIQKQRQQLQQQQLQQQFAASRSNNKTPPTSNGGGYGDHLATSSPSAASKFSNTVSGFPQNPNNNGPSQSHWKSSGKTVPQPPSSSLKNLPQHQQVRLQQSHTQISFGSGEKPQIGVPESSSSPMRVGSPTNSLSKSASGSPRTPNSNSQVNKAASLSSQQSKNPSILGNPNNIASSNSGTKSLVQQQHHQQQHQQLKQLQLNQQRLQSKQMGNNQPQLFFSSSYMQTQPPQSTSNPSNATSGYYLQRQYPDNSKEAKPGSGTESSSMKGPLQGSMSQSQFQVQPSGSFSFAHTVPAGGQVKPITEQKQPAGNLGKK